MKLNKLILAASIAGFSFLTNAAPDDDFAQEVDTSFATIAQVAPHLMSGTTVDVDIDLSVGPGGDVEDALTTAIKSISPALDAAILNYINSKTVPLIDPIQISSRSIHITIDGDTYCGGLGSDITFQNIRQTANGFSFEADLNAGYKRSDLKADISMAGLTAAGIQFFSANIGQIVHI